MLFRIWHEEFDEFWPEHLKVSNIFILMCSFWAKYILFELKKHSGVIFHETEEGYKIWREIDLSFHNWHKEFLKFWPEHSKVSKIFTLMDTFWTKYILSELKKYRGVIFHETEEGYKLRKNWLVVWKMTWGIWQISPEHLQKSYVSWQWIMIQKLKRNWLE